MSASSIRRAESMLKITVQRDGTGDFTTISEAVLAVPYECEAEIVFRCGNCFADPGEPIFAVFLWVCGL